MVNGLDKFKEYFEDYTNKYIFIGGTACNIPIATGERLFNKYYFKRSLNIGGVYIIQPDLFHAGGITEVKKIASMAEAYDVALAPYCPLGPIALSVVCRLMQHPIMQQFKNKVLVFIIIEID